MSTRKQRHDGNRERGWQELNTTFGQDGLMESEAWYTALAALPDLERVSGILEAHFGDLEAARHSFETLDEEVAKRYRAVWDAFTEEEDARSASH